MNNTDLRAKIARIRNHRHWRYAMRQVLLSNGIPESEIESRLATLTQEQKDGTEEGPQLLTEDRRNGPRAANVAGLDHSARARA